MKVRLDFTVEVDLEEWCLSYGNYRISERAIKSDVINYARNILSESPAPINVIRG